MVQISRKDLEALAIGFGIADFFAEGKLSAPFGRAAKAALRKAGPAIGRGIIRYGPAAVSTVGRVTPQGAAISTAAVIAIQNREKIADLAAQGYEIAAPIVPAAQQYGAGVVQRALDPEIYKMRTDFPREGPGLLEKFTGKRKPSPFNRAVKKGMKVVKDSASYGKKGTINNAKKAFSAVTKAASAVTKGKKAPRKGIKARLMRTMRTIR